LEPDRRRYLDLSLFYFGFLGVLGLFTPYFSLFLDARGLSPLAISGLLSLWYLTRVVTPGAWAWLVGKSAQPIAWLRFAFAVSALAFIAMQAPLGTAGIAVLLLVFSALYNAIMPQFETVTLSHLGPGSTRYSSIRVWGSVGFVVAVIAGGWAVEHASAAWLPLYTVPWFALALASVWRNDYGPWNREPAPPGGAALRHLVGRREVAVFLFAALLMQMSHGPYYIFYSLHLAGSGYSGRAIGLYWALGVVAEIAALLVMRSVLQHHSAARVMQVCLAAGCGRWLLTAFLPSSASAMALAQLAHALTFGAFHAASMQLVVRFFPGALVIRGQGLLYGFSSGVGGVLGGLAAGGFWHLGGGRAAFLFAALVSLAGFTLSAWAIKPRARN